MSNNLPAKTGGEDKTQLYITGAVLGLLLGLLSAHLYGRAVEENTHSAQAATDLSSGDLVKLGLLLLGFVRQVTEFGSTTARSQEAQQKAVPPAKK